MVDLILPIVSSVTASGLLTAGLIFLARTWIGERIKKSIEHEYQVALERLRVDNAQQQSVQAAAMTAFSASRHATTERRLDSIEKLWSAILKLKAMTPTAVAHADILLASEYKEFHTNPDLASLLRDVSSIEMARKPV